MSLQSSYEEFIHLSRYSRWMEEEGKRESWTDTVERWQAFWIDHLVTNFGFSEREARDLVVPLGQAVYDTDVMPSMRSLMTAGPALKRDNAAGFNCSYLEISTIAAFAEVLYILACGTGVGFSAERQVVARLPQMNEGLFPSDTTIVVADSKIGWARAFRELLTLLYDGQVPKWDLSRIRPKGARLKTFGGRASGPGPLDRLFKFTVATFKEVHRAWKAGERELPKLTSLEVHDIVCMTGDCIVSGGVRRSALISLSNLSDDRMRGAKMGDWREHNKHRELANNSAAYTEKPDFRVFMEEMKSMYESYSGERGIFSRVAAQRKAAENGRRDPAQDFGTNPCGEIILPDQGFCNLSEVVARATDTLEDLKRKVKIATIIGTLQSTLTNFRFLRSKWKQNADAERLLGVSITGIMDHPQLRVPNEETALWLQQLKALAIETNAQMAGRLGINPSAAITTVKPSGTVSQLVNSASGIHPRYSQFYIRRVTNDDSDPITAFLKAAGVPHEAKHGKEGLQTIFSFPIAAPPGPTRDQIDAMQQLEVYAMYRTHWCEHNPSTTIYYTDNNFFAVAQWIWENFDRVGGVSFLPFDGGKYEQAPYEEIDAATYERLLSEMPKIDWNLLQAFEQEDSTNPQGERACMGGACEI